MKNAVDFEASRAGDFTESLAMERNVGAIHTRWRAGLNSAAFATATSIYTPGASIPAGYSMGQSFVRSAQYNDGTYDKLSVPFRNHVQPAIITNYQGASLSRSIQYDGNPLVRYFFRVKGMAEMTGWDGSGEIDYDSADPLGNIQGNSYFISSSHFRPKTQTEKINVIAVDDSASQVNLRDFSPPWIEINRTMEPDGFGVKGCFVFDRIVSITGTVAPTVTFTIGVRLSAASMFRARFLNGGSDPGNYPPNAGATVFGDEIRSENKTFMFGNPTSANPRSLYDDNRGSGMIEDTQIPARPVSHLNIVEAIYLGCRAEESVREEKITDLSAPILLTEFDD